jgi:hypothetical protein
VGIQCSGWWWDWQWSLSLSCGGLVLGKFAPNIIFIKDCYSQQATN